MYHVSILLYFRTRNDKDIFLYEKNLRVPYESSQESKKKSIYLRKSTG